MTRVILMGPAARVNKKFRSLLSGLRLTDRDFLIGIDGGVAHWRKLGYRPGFSIGDWDSLRSRKLLEGLDHKTLPPDKNRSDLHFALKVALALVSQSATEILCLGVTGGPRPDHHLASLLELCEFAEKLPAQVKALAALDSDCRYDFVAPKMPWKRSLPIGKLISVFALGKEARGVTLRGMKYLLKNERLLPSSHGLSNVITSSAATARVLQGALVLVQPCQPGVR